MTTYFALPGDLPERLAARAAALPLAQDNLLHLEPETLHPAAVLIPLVNIDGQWNLLFTRRSANLHSHPGQVSFPGGAWEPTDRDIVCTALRETQEEIGIPPEKVTVLGKMSHMDTVSYFNVTPVVGIVEWPCELILNADEVARAFFVPLDFLLTPGNLRFETREFEGQTIQVPFFKPYDGETVWGVTGNIILGFLALLR